MNIRIIKDDSINYMFINCEKLVLVLEIDEQLLNELIYALENKIVNSEDIKIFDIKEVYDVETEEFFQ